MSDIETALCRRVVDKILGKVEECRKNFIRILFVAICCDNIVLSELAKSDCTHFFCNECLRGSMSINPYTFLVYYDY